MAKNKYGSIKGKKLNKKQKKRLEDVTKETITDSIPIIETKFGMVACIICHVSKGATLLYVDKTKARFSFGGHTYFLYPEGEYITDLNMRVAVYLEGISIPLSHKNVETEVKERSYTDARGKEHKMNVTFIKNLKFDSAVIDSLFNGGMIEKLSQQPQDKTIFAILIISIFSVIISVVNIGISIYLNQGG